MTMKKPCDVCTTMSPTSPIPDVYGAANGVMSFKLDCPYEKVTYIRSANPPYKFTERIDSTLDYVYHVTRRAPGTADDPSVGLYSKAILLSEPVAYWPLLTDAKDIAGSYSGTPMGGVSFGANGPWGGNGATSFNGTNAYIRVPYTPALNPSAVTYEVWVKPPSTPTADRYIMSSRMATPATTGNALLHRTNGGGQASWWVQGTQNLTNSALRVGSWYHLVGTFDGGSVVAFYVNGIKQTAASPGTGGLNTTDPFYIGCNRGPSAYFAGSLCHAAVYNRALPATEVMRHFNVGGAPVS